MYQPDFALMTRMKYAFRKISVLIFWPLVIMAEYIKTPTIYSLCVFFVQWTIALAICELRVSCKWSPAYLFTGFGWELSVLGHHLPEWSWAKNTEASSKDFLVGKRWSYDLWKFFFSIFFLSSVFGAFFSRTPYGAGILRYVDTIDETLVADRSDFSKVSEAKTRLSWSFRGCFALGFIYWNSFECERNGVAMNQFVKFSQRARTRR